MRLAPILLGVIDIAIVIAILILVGLIIVWFAGLMSFPIPGNIQRVYLAIVFLIGLYMLVALLFNLPSVRIMGGGPPQRLMSGDPVGSVPQAPQTRVIR